MTPPEPKSKETIHYEIKKVSDLPDEPPPIIIGKILYRGGKLLISAPSKGRKTWLVLELVYCVANGFPWWGQTINKGEIIYLNFELMEWEVRSRLEEIQKCYTRKGLKGNFERINILNLRGRGFKLDDLPQLSESLSGRTFHLAVVDPAYKLLSGLNESDTGDIIRFMNALEKFAYEIQAAIVICHHFSKGAQDKKEAMDRASGSGVWSRDPDALITISALKTCDHYSVEVDLRSFPKMQKWVIRYAHPCFEIAEGEDPEDLKGSKTSRNGTYDLEALIDLLDEDEYIFYTPYYERAKRIMKGISQSTFDRKLKEGVTLKKLIKDPERGYGKRQ